MFISSGVKKFLDRAIKFSDCAVVDLCFLSDIHSTTFQMAQEKRKLDQLEDIDDGLEMIYRISIKCGIYIPVMYSADDFPKFDKCIFNNHLYIIGDEFLKDDMDNLIRDFTRTTLQSLEDKNSDDESSDENDDDDVSGSGNSNDSNKRGGSSSQPVKQQMSINQGIETIGEIAGKFKIFIPIIFTADDFPGFRRDAVVYYSGILSDELLKDMGDEIEDHIRGTLEQIQAGEL